MTWYDSDVSGHCVDVFQKKGWRGRGFFVGCWIIGQRWDNHYIFYNLSVMIFLFFLGVRRPAINYSRKLVQAYTRIGMYQKKKCNKVLQLGWEPVNGLGFAVAQDISWLSIILANKCDRCSVMMDPNAYPFHIKCGKHCIYVRCDIHFWLVHSVTHYLTGLFMPGHDQEFWLTFGNLSLSQEMWWYQCDDGSIHLSTT